jgi:succinate dehydrogenase / fumarate reductase cytochrome b subunit
MLRASNHPKWQNFLNWFTPSGRKSGSWAFILSRITALGLTLYLFMHLLVLGQLAQGPGAYDQFIELTHNPIFGFGELLVIAAGLIHGLNGLRVIVNSFSVGVPQHKALFYSLMVLAFIGIVAFGIKIFF